VSQKGNAIGPTRRDASQLGVKLFRQNYRSGKKTVNSEIEKLRRKLESNSLKALTVIVIGCKHYEW
jgi:hypothetical protein